MTGLRSRSLLAAVVLGAGATFAQSAGTNELASLSSAGLQGPADAYEPWVSSDGRLIAFHTDSPLVAGDGNGLGDVFLRDRAAGTTVRLSESAPGAEADGASFRASLSADGAWCVFTSDATNLVPGDTNGVADVFLKSVATGAITRVSVSSAGAQADRASAQSTISADGSTVVFGSLATNLDGTDLNPSWDIFLHDVASGTTQLVSRSSAGVQANNKCFDPAVSARGDRVAYASVADNLVPGDTNVDWDVFVFDVAAGTTERISTSATGGQADGGSFDPFFAADGALVAFESDALGLVDETYLLFSDVFVKVLATGELQLISKNDQGEQANLSAGSPAITPDGRFVTFRSRADNLVPGDGTGEGGWDVFVFDRSTETIERISVDPDGLDPNGTSSSPCISADGSVVVYDSFASNLVANDANHHVQDVFAWVRPSAPWDDLGQGLAGAAGVPELAATGPLVAFGSTSIALTGAAASAPGAFVFGVSALQLPFQGGILVPSPDVVVPVTTSAGGAAGLELHWQAIVPSGLGIWSQAWVLDFGAPQGFAASNAVHAEAF